MKKLPEKIYATPNFDRRWQTKAIDDESVEYVRKDTFIEKAEEFIYIALNNGIMSTANIEDFMRLFKKYMEYE